MECERDGVEEALKWLVKDEGLEKEGADMME